MTDTDNLFCYALALADDALVLGHRLSEWSSHGPTLEEDIALSNLGLDLIGQARLFYTLAGDVEGKGRNEDDLAYFRDDRQYRTIWHDGWRARPSTRSAQRCATIGRTRAAVGQVHRQRYHRRPGKRA